MKTCVIRRKNQQEYDDMMKMLRWLRLNYGSEGFEGGWGADWAWQYGNGAECVEFKFYDDRIATAFVLKYSNFIINHEYETVHT